MSTSHADLLAQIYENPRDLALRSIYADALQAAGDPRGDFIALQLARADFARADALLDLHWHAWLGPVATCARRGDIAFRNGFVAAVSIHQPTKMSRLEWHRVHRAAEWSTVESLLVDPHALTLASADDFAGLLSYGPFASLRTIDLPAAILRLVRDTDRPALRSAAVSADSEPFDLRPSLVRGTNLLCRRLGWNHRDPIDSATWQLALDAATKSLTLSFPYQLSVVARHLVEALATPRPRPRPPTLWYRFPDCHVTIRQDAIELRTNAEPDADFRAVGADALRHLAPVLDRFARVDLVVVTDTTEHAVLGTTGPDAVAWLNP